MPCVFHPTFLQFPARGHTLKCNPSNFGVALQALIFGAVVGMANCNAETKMEGKAVQEYPILLSVAKL